MGRPARRPVERSERPAPERGPRAEPEVWIDEGPVRRAASSAARRAAGAPTGRQEPDRAPRPVVPKPAPGAGTRRAAVLAERVAEAERALDRERYLDVRRMLLPIVAEAPDMATAREVLGLAYYRLGRWRQAVNELETFRTLGGGVNHHPILMDCYRALKRFEPINELWAELKEASPSAALVAEGRIVVAGVMADRRDIAGAIELLRQHEKTPARVREHHLRLWYVLGDLYDRNGETIKARTLFTRILGIDPEFADVRDRLRGLGS